MAQRSSDPDAVLSFWHNRDRVDHDPPLRIVSGNDCCGIAVYKHHVDRAKLESALDRRRPPVPVGAAGYSDDSKGSLERPAQLFCKAACRYSALPKAQIPHWPVWTLFHGIRGNVLHNNTSRLFLYLEEQFRGTGVALFILLYTSVAWQANRLVRDKRVAATTAFETLPDRFHRCNSTVASKAWIGSRYAKDYCHEIANR